MPLHGVRAEGGGSIITISGHRYAELSALARWSAFDPYQVEGKPDVLLFREDRIVELKIGSPFAVIDGQTKKLVAAPVKRGANIFVPFDAITSYFQLAITFDEKQRLVKVEDLRFHELFELPLDRNSSAVPLLRDHVKRATDLYLSAVKLHKSGNPARAKDELQACLAIDPNYPEAHFALGRLLLEMDDKGAAATEFKAALSKSKRWGPRSEALRELRRLRVESPTPEVPSRTSQNQSQKPFSRALPGVVWVHKDSFRSPDTAGTIRSIVSRYQFRADGTGQFGFTWLSGRTDVHRFTWHTDGGFVILTYLPSKEEQWPEWTSRVRWSVSDDGEVLTILTTESDRDIRASNVAGLKIIGSALSNAGIEASPDLLSSIDTAIYTRE